MRSWKGGIESSDDVPVIMPDSLVEVKEVLLRCIVCQTSYDIQANLVRGLNDSILVMIYATGLIGVYLPRMYTYEIQVHVKPKSNFQPCYR